MEILSYKRMRIYRKEGKCAVVLNLTLPTVEGDGGAHFRDYYDGIEGAIYKGAERLVGCYDGAPITVSVDFSSPASDKTLVILRSIKIKMRHGTVTREFYDTFDFTGIPIRSARKKKARAN